MSTTFNTSYKVQVDVDTDAVRNQYNIEEGAIVTTESGVWTVYGGAWVKLYPQGGVGSGLGWARYDDSIYTSSNKLTLVQDTEVELPNNANTSYRSYTGIDYYNGTTRRVSADAANETYIMTVVFKCSAANANSTYLETNFMGENGTPYDRIRQTISFPKGNDVAHDYHGVFQYYADANFATNGSWWEILSIGGSAQIWDIIYFIQKTQSYV